MLTLKECGRWDDRYDYSDWSDNRVVVEEEEVMMVVEEGRDVRMKRHKLEVHAEGCFEH